MSQIMVFFVCKRNTIAMVYNTNQAKAHHMTILYLQYAWHLSSITHRDKTSLKKPTRCHNTTYTASPIIKDQTLDKKTIYIPFITETWCTVASHNSFNNISHLKLLFEPWTNARTREPGIIVKVVKCYHKDVDKVTPQIMESLTGTSYITQQ